MNAKTDRMDQPARPSLLCTADLDCVPDTVRMLRREFELDYRPNDRDFALHHIGAFDAFWGYVDFKVDKQVLDRATRLKVIASATTGTDHIDKDEAARRGIAVLCIARDYGLLRSFTATAECAWMLMLACHRHLRSALRRVEQGGWGYQGLAGQQLYGKTLGVLGLGRLGRMTCGFGRGFGMRVLGCDRRDIDPPIDGVQLVDFDALLRESDAISIHIHMTRDNYHLFNADAFARMKHGAVLVNTSRGDVIDEAALIAALESGRLAAFGADVLHDEWRATMSESPVVRYSQTHDNVVITPHFGGATEHSICGAREFMARKLVHFFKTGEELTLP